MKGQNGLQTMLLFCIFITVAIQSASMPFLLGYAMKHAKECFEEAFAPRKPVIIIIFCTSSITVCAAWVILICIICPLKVQFSKPLGINLKIHSTDRDASYEQLCNNNVSLTECMFPVPVPLTCLFI